MYGSELCNVQLKLCVQQGSHLIAAMGQPRALVQLWAGLTASEPSIWRLRPDHVCRRALAGGQQDGVRTAAAGL